MKKILISLAIILVAAGMFGSFNQTQAKTYTIDFTNKSNVKKVKSNKLSVGGLKIGNKISSYKNKKDFRLSDSRATIGYLAENRLNENYINSVWANKFSISGYTDFQEKTKYNNRKLNRIAIRWIMKPNTKNNIRKVYGKPIYSYSLRGEQSGYLYSVDSYKYATFIYNASSGKLEYVHLTKYKTNSEVKNWMNFVKLSELKSSITKEEWNQKDYTNDDLRFLN